MVYMGDCSKEEALETVTCVRILCPSAAMPSSSAAFLDSVEGEISLFRSIMRARPIGIHRHFHLIQIRASVHAETGVLLSVQDIWAKLRTCYNLDALDALDENGFSSSTTPTTPSSQTVLQDFELPRTSSYESLMQIKRQHDADSMSATSREVTPETASQLGRSTRKRRQTSKARSNVLLPGESDSSLTEQSVDDLDTDGRREDSVAPTTDEGDATEDDNEDEETESIASKQGNKATKANSKKGQSSTSARPSASSSTNAKPKKRKR
ncbi:chromatin modification-related protein EAF7-domain-containing protein [Flagelloscypha sp. PMI_526]|nr:chromatin modification-related protein EAF7-domain-containing protein [Flagelloscypha sp. PMI_526]